MNLEIYCDWVEEVHGIDPRGYWMFSGFDYISYNNFIAFSDWYGDGGLGKMLLSQGSGIVDNKGMGYWYYRNF